jgi:hypothetical protein
MTHGPAKYRLDISSSSESLGCPHLFRVMGRIRTKLHVFGHVNDAYGSELVQWHEEGEMPDDDDTDGGIKEKMRIKGFLDDSVRQIRAGKGERGAETVFVNTALMGNNGELENTPWLVDLESEQA